MSMIKKPLLMAKEYVAGTLRAGELAIDATAGNGYDTLFLAQQVGDTGKVFSFDIQEKALQKTRQLLETEKLAHRVKLICCSHEYLANHINGQQVGAIMFNLGYLPGGDHSIVTRPETTIKAMGAGLAKLKNGGLLTAVLYSGHAGGLEEKNAVLNYAASLEQKSYHVLHYDIINKSGFPPSLLVIEKI
jgi:predicted methyltransferase